MQTSDLTHCRTSKSEGGFTGGDPDKGAVVDKGKAIELSALDDLYYICDLPSRICEQVNLILTSKDSQFFRKVA
jgi:hypothetical protein